MFLQLKHTRLDIYEASRAFLIECYRISNLLPQEEKYILSAQIRRASLSVHLNIAEGYTRSSTSERKRFLEIARGSLVEVDAAIGIANDLCYLENINLKIIESNIIRCFQLLSGVIRGLKTQNPIT